VAFVGAEKFPEICITLHYITVIKRVEKVLSLAVIDINDPINKTWGSWQQIAKSGTMGTSRTLSW